MHRFGQISDRVPAERHVLDEAENSYSVLRGDVSPPLQILCDHRSDRLVPQFALRRQRYHQSAGKVLRQPADLVRQSRDVVLANIGEHLVGQAGARFHRHALVARGNTRSVDCFVEVRHLDELVAHVRGPLDAVVAEAGISDLESFAWFGLLVPKGTPKSIVDRLHSEVVKIMSDPAVQKRMIDIGADPVYTSQAEFKALISSEVIKWRNLIKEAGISSN
jgi:hypothetical protein